jgi:hypothetical protein
MYQDRQLKECIARKAAIIRKIGILRVDVTADATRVAQPLYWFDKIIGFFGQSH